MTAKLLATTLLTLGIILPASVTLIFKNGCRQDYTYAAPRSQTNAPSVGTSAGAGTAQGQFTDINRRPLKEQASKPKAP
jgi:hypothetical protein